MKILILKKKNSSLNWSDSLSLLSKNLSLIENCNIYHIDISYNLLSNYKKLSKLKHNHGNEFDFILVHHSIVFYFSFFYPLLLNIKKKIFFAHEGEFHLGWNYALKNNQIKNIGSLFRYSRIWNTLPTLFFDDVYCLSKLQSIQYPKSKIIHFLGVNEDLFKPIDIKKTQKILFPANILRYEKGWSLLDKKIQDICIYPDNTKNSEMPLLYNQVKFVVIPSIFETYCLALIEALLCNKIIITTKNVGLAADLLNDYDFNTLASLGLFIFNDINDINDNFESIIELNVKPKTRAFAIENKLSSKLSALNLYDSLLEEL
ncbi:glycosyltransferase [Escherichia coli]